MGAKPQLTRNLALPIFILEGPCVLQIVQMVILTGLSSLKDRASAQFDVDSAESNRKKKPRNEDTRHAGRGWKCCRSKRYAWFLLTAKMQFRRESWKVYAKAESGELILSECASSNEPHNKLNHDALLQYGSGEKGRRS